MTTRSLNTLLCGFLLALCGLLVGRPAQATSLQYGVSTITYNDGVRKIYSFAIGADENLYTHYWNGSGWHWAKLGHPGIGLSSVSAVTFNSNGVRWIYAFAASTNNNLYVDVWNGSQWTWLSLGHPAADLIGKPIAMTYFDGTAQQIRVVCSANFTGLYLLSMQGYSASWRTLGNGNQGAPGALTAVNYLYQGVPYFDAFAIANGTADTFRDAWHGNTGYAWTDQGHPSGFGGSVAMAAVTYPVASGAPYIYDFPASQYTNNLYVKYGRGTSWQWADQGNPGTKVYSPSALVIGSAIYVFCSGYDGNLYVNYWNGSGWFWANQGRPSTTDLVTPSPSSSISYDDGALRIYVFGVGLNGDLCVNYWNGSAWKWADQGQP